MTGLKLKFTKINLIHVQGQQENQIIKKMQIHVCKEHTHRILHSINNRDKKNSLIQKTTKIHAYSSICDCNINEDISVKQVKDLTFETVHYNDITISKINQMSIDIIANDHKDSLTSYGKIYLHADKLCWRGIKDIWKSSTNT